MRKFINIPTKKLVTGVAAFALATVMTITSVAPATFTTEAYAEEFDVEVPSVTIDDVRKDAQDTANYLIANSTVSSAYDYKLLLFATAAGVDTSELQATYFEKVNTTWDAETKTFAGTSYEYATECAVVYMYNAFPNNTIDKAVYDSVFASMEEKMDACETAADLNKLISNPYLYQIVVPTIMQLKTNLSEDDVKKLYDALMTNYKKDETTAAFNYWGVSTDNQGTILPAVAYFLPSQEAQTVIDETLEFIKGNQQEDGSFVSDKTSSWGNAVNGDSTGLALNMYASLGKLDSASKVYESLSLFKSEDTLGAYGYTNKTANKMATNDIFVGLVSLLNLMTGNKTVFDLKAEKVTGLAQKAATTSVISITFNKGTSQNYDIYRSTKKDGTYKLVGSVKKGYFRDTNLKAGKTYYYKVATTAGRNSIAYSKILTATTKPAKVTKVKVVKVGKTYVTLSYKAVTGATSYEIYRATSRKGTYKKIATTRKTTYKNTKLKSGKAYFYKVVAVKKINSKRIYKGAKSSVFAVKTNK